MSIRSTWLDRTLWPHNIRHISQLIQLLSIVSCLKKPTKRDEIKNSISARSNHFLSHQPDSVKSCQIMSAIPLHCTLFQILCKPKQTSRHTVFRPEWPSQDALQTSAWSRRPSPILKKSISASLEEDFENKQMVRETKRGGEREREIVLRDASLLHSPWFFV